MRLDEKILIGFIIAWVCLALAVLVTMGIRRDGKRLPKDFWVNWGNVLAIWLMGLSTHDRQFVNAHETLLTSLGLTWTVFLIWSKRESLWEGIVGKKKDVGAARPIPSDRT